MIKNRNYILTDKQGKELLDKEKLLLFDFFAYEGDIHQYAADHLPAHWHEELELFILMEGVIQIGIGDSIYQLQAGDGCFINTEVIHSFTASVPSPCRYRSFVFSPTIISGTPGSVFDILYVRPLLESRIPFLLFPKSETDTLFSQQFDCAFSACSAENYGYELRIRNALSEIFLYIKSKSTGENKTSIPSVQEMRLKEMLLWIDQHQDHPIKVSDIANVANICIRECQRIFNQYLHCSPVEYMQRRRIFHAARLLSDTDLPITDIALNCGFSNPSYFSKQFKLLMKSTPREYRDAIRTTLPPAPDERGN